MGKRYHCEYCNRSFADTPQTRKNHINGVQHKRNRKLHYDSFKDPAVLLAEESSKPPCRKFFTTGSCGFGDSCWYSHTNPQMLLAAQGASSQTSINVSQANQPEPKLEDWLKKWEKKQKKNESKDMSGTSAHQSVYTLPPGLPPPQMLPPSLLPPPPGGYPDLPRIDWG